MLLECSILPNIATYSLLTNHSHKQLVFYHFGTNNFLPTVANIFDTIDLQCGILIFENLKWRCRWVAMVKPFRLFSMCSNYIMMQ